jgi:hypothetical protein
LGCNSAVGCEKINRLGDGFRGGLGVGTSCQRRRNSTTLAYSLPVRLARFLQRAPDAAGLSAYTGQLQQGAADEQVIAQLVGSPEFFAAQPPPG